MPIDTSLLQPVAAPQPFNFAALQQSMLQGQQRDTNLSAGDLAAQGNYSGAAARAYQGGNAPLAATMFDAGNAQHAAGLKSQIEKVSTIQTPADWNRWRASVLAAGGNDPGGFDQKDAVLGHMTDALDPEAAANRTVQLAVLNKPSIERTVDPVTGQISFVRVGPYSGSAQPVGMGGAAPPQMAEGGGQPPPNAAMPPSAPPAASGDRFGNYFDPAQLQQANSPTVGAQPAGASQGPTGGQTPALDPSVEAAISRQPANYQGVMRGLASYTVDPRLERAAGRGGIIALTQQADPTYDPSQFPIIQNTKKNFASGLPAQAITSINKVVGHLGSFNDIIDALGNNNAPIIGDTINAASNALAGGGGGKQAAVLTKARTAVTGVGTEIAKAMRGTGAVSEGEINNWLHGSGDMVNAAPDKQKAWIQQGLEMLLSQKDALANQYSMGTRGQSISILTPQSQAIVDKILNGPEQTPPPDTPPSGGSGKFVWSADKGLVPQ